MTNLINENYGMAKQYRQASIDYIKQGTHGLLIVNTSAIGGIFILLSSLYNIFTKASFEWLFGGLALFGICLLLTLFLNLRNATVFSVLSIKIYNATNTMANISDDTISDTKDFESKQENLKSQMEDMNKYASQELRLDAVYMIITCVLLSFGIGSIANALLLLKFSNSCVFLGILMGVVLSMILSCMYMKLIFSSANILMPLNKNKRFCFKKIYYSLLVVIFIALFFLGIFLVKQNSINKTQYSPFCFTANQNNCGGLKNLRN